MRLQLRDTPVRGKCFQPQVLGAQLESAGQFDGAHGGVYGQLRVDHLGLGGQERVIEPDVVRHQSAATEQIDQIADDVGEAGLALQHLGGQPVDMGRSGIDSGVEQCVEAPFDVAVVAQSQRRDADDPGMSWVETRGLHVDDGPARAVFGCRAAPGAGRPATFGT